MNVHYSNPGELQKYLSTFDYKMGKNYTFQSPRDFEKNKSGICWDYAEYEAWAFNTHFTTFKMTAGKLRNNTYSLYFTQHKGHDGSKEYPTHTWLAYMEMILYMLSKHHGRPMRDYISISQNRI